MSRRQLSGRADGGKKQVLIEQSSKSLCFSQRIILVFTFSRGGDLFQAFSNSQLASHASVHTHSSFHLEPSWHSLVTFFLFLFATLLRLIILQIDHRIYILNHFKDNMAYILINIYF